MVKISMQFESIEHVCFKSEHFRCVSRAKISTQFDINLKVLFEVENINTCLELSYIRVLRMKISTQFEIISQLYFEDENIYTV